MLPNKQSEAIWISFLDRVYKRKFQSFTADSYFKMLNNVDKIILPGTVFCLV